MRLQRVGRDLVTKHGIAREARGCVGLPQLLELFIVAEGVVLLQNTLLFFSTQQLGLLDLGRLFCTLMIIILFMVDRAFHKKMSIKIKVTSNDQGFKRLFFNLP